jgi:hypothetical protein
VDLVDYEDDADLILVNQRKSAKSAGEYFSEWTQDWKIRLEDFDSSTIISENLRNQRKNTFKIDLIERGSRGL